MGGETPTPSCLGVGLGLLIATITTVSLGAVDPSHSGIAAGTLNTARQAGSIVGVALFGSLSARDLGAGLRLTVAGCVALSLLLVILALLVPFDG